MLKMISFFILLQLSFFASYCGSCLNRSGREGYYELTKIPYQNETERVQKLLSFSRETQIDIYLFARECEEDYRVQEIFYDIGNDKVLEIAKRIQQSKDEKDKMNLIWALFYIEYKCHCVKTNPNVIEIITNAQSRISESDTVGEKYSKEMYKKTLNSLIQQKK